MYTRCPKCSTCFRVTERHLAIAKGKVRCGQCKHVFNAPEHAIDDLPTNPTGTLNNNKTTAIVTPPVKTEIEKPVSPVQETKTTHFSPGATEKKIYQESETEKPVNDTSTPDQQAVKAAITEINKPAFQADATMVIDSTALNKKNLSNSVLNATADEENDIFDDNFDLNAAIEELTHNVEDESVIDKKEITRSVQPAAEEKSSHNVFTTDAYDATKASSVAAIMDEMEGQLSLNIPEPRNDEYDANKEFEFIELDSETDNSNIEEESNDQTLAKFFDMDELKDIKPKNEKPDENTADEFAFIETDNESGQDKTERKNIHNEQINEDELFNHVDLSDLTDSNILEDVILDASKHSPDDAKIPFQLRNDLNHLQVPAPRRIHPVFSLSFIIILLILSFSQIAYFRAHELVSVVPSTRPVLEKFCAKVHCHYSGPRDTKKIQLISRDVRLHPKEKKALLISAAMINNASFAQPYPNIHIRLSDISGNVVAERIFNAKTYLGKLSTPFLLMKSKTPVHINFEVVDPGNDAINFEFTFL